MDVSSHTITINKSGTPNTISIVQATPAANSILQIDAHVGNRIISLLNDVPSTIALQIHSQQKLPTNTDYVVDQIEAHKQTTSGAQYQVRWNGYTPNEDTFEAPDHTPNHLITKY